MKVIRITSTTVLSLLLGVAAPAYTQQEQHAQQQEGKHEEGKPSPQHAQQQHQPEGRQQQQQRARQTPSLTTAIADILVQTMGSGSKGCPS